MTQSVFLNLARDGKNGWWRPLILFLVIILGQVIGAVAFELLYISNNSNISLEQLFDIGSRGDILIFTEILVAFSVSLIFFCIAFQFLHKRKVNTLITVLNRFNWQLYFQGFAAQAIILTGMLLITERKEVEEFITTFSLGKFLILLVLGFVTFGIQAFSEEVMFRGYFFQVFSLLKINTIWSILLSSIFFGLLHLASGTTNFIDATFFGISACLIVLWHNRIEFVSGAHNANNLFIALFIGDIGKALSANFEPKIDISGILLSILGFVILMYFGYQLGNKGKLNQTPV